MKNKNYIKKSLKFFKDVKYQLLIIGLFYLTLGIIGFISPIVYEETNKFIEKIDNLDS